MSKIITNNQKDNMIIVMNDHDKKVNDGYPNVGGIFVPKCDRWIRLCPNCDILCTRGVVSCGKCENSMWGCGGDCTIYWDECPKCHMHYSYTGLYLDDHKNAIMESSHTIIPKIPWQCTDCSKILKDPTIEEWLECMTEIPMWENLPPEKKKDVLNSDRDTAHADYSVVNFNYDLSVPLMTVIPYCPYGGLPSIGQLSEYTINLSTMKPTKNSPCQVKPDELLCKLISRKNKLTFSHT
jgi:hypothetical protein